MSLWYLLAGGAASLGGLGLIFGSWRRALPAGLHPTLLGWLLLLLAAWPWILSLGAEFGITLAFLVPSVLAWALVAVNRQLRRRREQAAAPVLKEGSRGWGRHVVLFLLVVPLAAVASALVTVALSLLLPWREVDAMVLVLVVMPILWGALGYWAVADARTVRPALAMVVGSLTSGVFIYV